MTWYLRIMHNTIQIRPRLCFSSIAIFILLFYKGLNILIIWKTPCYYSNAGDVLPAAENLSISSNRRTIFFHETSCRGGLTARQACAVEAAARAHPQWQVYVLFNSPVTDYTLKTTCLTKLLQFNNVKFARVHVAEFSKGTMAQSVLLNDLKHSLFPIHHAADILRILTLNKWGGIYLDTDMIVTRSLEHLPPNFIAKESYVNVASGILSFAKDEIGTNVTNAIIKEMCQHYLPDYWSANGAEAINRVIRRICPKLTKSVKYESQPISNCKGIMIFDYELFYPLYFTDLDEIFQPPDKEDLLFDLERPYTYHMWNKLTSKKNIKKNTVYEIIVQKFCPTIHDAYIDEFGAK